jgi:transcriptional regulator with XRE-family HTH domain
MARMSSRPKRTLVRYRGLPYEIDLVRCRRALVECQIDGTFDSMEGLAGTLGISRSTTSRFFSGRGTSLTVLLKLLGALKLKFEDVATLVDEDDDAEEPDGPTNAGARKRPAPPRPQPGSMVELKRQVG